MKIVIMGIQGCGKGTQAKMIAKEYSLNHISTGDLFRKNIQLDTDFGKEIKNYLKKGTLVPDNFVFEILKPELNKNEKGFILDGFPRNLSQAEYLIKITDIDVVLFFDLDEKVAIERISARKRCEDCNIDYNLIKKPKKDGFCDKCGQELFVREDDRPEAIKKRIDKFFTETKPLINFFQEKKILHIINVNKAPEEIYKEIKDILKKHS